MSRTDEDRLTTYGHLLAATGGTARKADLRARTGLDATQAARICATLTRRGLAEDRDRRTVLALTATGRAMFATRPSVNAGALLDQVLHGWPSRLAAFAQLAALATLARPFTGTAPRLGLALIGATGTGKTSASVFLATLAGLDPDAHLLHLPALTENPTGRREREAGTATGYTFRPAPWLGTPLVIFDEWDKATASQRSDLLGSALSTRGRITPEGHTFEVCPVPILTANPPRDAIGAARLAALGDARTGPAVRRRCIVLDTGTLSTLDPAALAVVAVAADRLDLTPRLPLAAFTMPTSPDPATVNTLAAFLREALTDDGRESPDAAALEPLARALHALDPDGIPREVATATVLAAFLTVAESIPGQVRPERSWDQQIVRWASDPQLATLPAAERVTAAAHAARTERDWHRAHLAAAVVEHTTAADTITEAAATDSEACRLLIVRLDGRRLSARGASDEQKATAAGLRKRLRDCREELARVRSHDGLHRAQLRAAEPRSRAAQLADTIDAAHQQHQDQGAAAKRHNAEQRRAAVTQRAVAQQHARAARAHAARELDQVRREARTWEGHYARADGRTTPRPLAVLAGHLTDRQLITYAPTNEPTPAGFLERLAHRLAPPEPGQWSTIGAPPLSFPGSTTRCAALDHWGPNTRAVIGPYLAYLHSAEDNLETRSNRRPRKIRPAIPDTHPIAAPRAITESSTTRRIEAR